MTEDATSPQPEETPTEQTPVSPVPPATGPEPGIGIGAGMVVGASAGIVIAVLAVFWIGFQGPAIPVDGSTAPDEPAFDDTQPGLPTPDRPATGTDILPPDKTGGGTLILQNVGNLDSVVVLADETTYSRAVYVRSGERVTIPDVAAGTFEVLIMLGRNWNTNRFAEAALYQTLDQPIEFAEREVDATTEYTRLTVSVEPWTPGLVGVRATSPFQLTP